MLKAASGLFGLLLALSATAWAEVTVAGPKFDFGSVPANSTLVYRTWLRNSSEDSVNIGDIKTGCGCLTAPLETWIIPPGDSVEMALLWRTRLIEGPETKQVYVYVIGTENPLQLELTATGITRTEEERGIDWEPHSFDFGTKLEGKEATRSVRLYNRTDEAIRVTVAEAPGEGPELRLPDELAAQGQAVGQVVLSKEAARMAFEDSFTLELATESGYIYRFSVPIVNGDFSFRPVLTKSEQ